VRAAVAFYIGRKNPTVSSRIPPGSGVRKVRTP
jgi:hypothetical protein